MSDQTILSIDRFVNQESPKFPQGMASGGGSSCSHSPDHSASVISIDELAKCGTSDEEEPLIQMLECRICQEEDSINNLEVPCRCSGSLKFAHRKCVQQWCNEKGNLTCEICRQSYQPNYIAPPPASHPDETTIDISAGWTISGAPADLHDPRILAMAAAERHFVEAQYDEYADSSTSGAAFCRSIALIVMAFLLLKYALTLNTSDSDDDDDSAFFYLFLLRTAGFLLPCYIMAWAISVLQHRRQRQEAEEQTASQVAFLLQAAQVRALQIAIAPAVAADSAETPHNEPVQ